jgi:rhamnose utilization protein RhaD (predicted bifunctional aldolase and dehydrogenase)
VLDSKEELIRLANSVGSDAGLVQGQGGNASLKEVGMLHVTASGMRLGEVSSPDDLVSLWAGGVRSILDDPVLRAWDLEERVSVASARLESLSPEGGNAPSIESFLHVIMPGEYTLHIHPVCVNALACMSGGEDAALEALDTETFAWVPYRRPGYEFACVLSDALDEHRIRFGHLPRLVLMQNHGLIVSEGTADDVLMTVRETVEMISNWFGLRIEEGGAVDSPPGLVEAARSIGDVLGLNAMPAGSAAIGLLKEDDKLRGALFAGVLTPDQAVYCGESPLLLAVDDSPPEIRGKAGEFSDNRGYRPRYAFIQGLGAVLLGRDPDESRLRAEVLDGVVKSLGMLIKKSRPSYIPSSEARALAGGE